MSSHGNWLEGSSGHGGCGSLSEICFFPCTFSTHHPRNARETDLDNLAKQQSGPTMFDEIYWKFIDPRSFYDDWIAIPKIDIHHRTYSSNFPLTA